MTEQQDLSYCLAPAISAGFQPRPQHLVSTAPNRIAEKVPSPGDLLAGHAELRHSIGYGGLVGDLAFMAAEEEATRLWRWPVDSTDLNRMVTKDVIDLPPDVVPGERSHAATLDQAATGRANEKPV